MAVKIQLRGDTKANWLLANPVISEREMVLETDTGKYKIGDGVNNYADLSYHGIDGKPSRITEDGFWEIYDPATDVYVKTSHKAVPEDVQVSVKTNNATTYILTFVYAAGTFDTPNLKGQDGATYDDTAVRNALTTLQNQINGLVSGNASVAIESFNEIIAFLANVEDTETLSGIIAGLNQSIANVQAAIPTKTSELQNDDHTVKDADYVHTDNNYSNEEKAKATESLRFKDITVATTLTGLSIANYSIKVTLSAASALSFASTPAEGWECMINIYNSSGLDLNQPLPNASDWLCEDTSMTIPLNGYGEISVRYSFGHYWVITKVYEPSGQHSG